MTAQELIDKAGGIGPSVVLIAICLNAGLSAVGLILDKIKDLTPGDADNKAADFVKKAIGAVQTIVDFLSANNKH